MSDESTHMNESNEQPSESAPVAEQPAATQEPAPAPQPAPEPIKATPARRPSRGGQVVGTGDTDEVSLSRCVIKNKHAKKSLSVHHVQRRLYELGYVDAYTDKDGWYGDLTVKAVREYQAANGLAGDGAVDKATLDHLFSDDPNVTVVD